MQVWRSVDKGALRAFFICGTLSFMKTETHPTYFPDAKVSCVCGNTFAVGSTKEKTEVEICSNCHPFYTGNEKILDAAGRVEKFKARAASAKTMAAKRAKANK